MPRYAVLLDLHDPDMRPIALVTEHDDAVRVHFAMDCGLKSLYEAPYEVTEPDGTTIRYVPGAPEYFNSVLNTLSRNFAAHELAEVEGFDPATLLSLYTAKIAAARSRRVVEYVAAGTESTYVRATSAADRRDPTAGLAAANPRDLALAA